MAVITTQYITEKPKNYKIHPTQKISHLMILQKHPTPKKDTSKNIMKSLMENTGYLLQKTVS
jgi:hypothetical protein